MKTYYLTTRSKTIELLIGAIILVIYGFLVLRSHPFLLLQVLIGEVVVFGLMCLGTLAFAPSITVSPDGIEHSQLFRHFKVEWDGIARIGKRWFSEGLIIRSGYLVTLKNTIPSNIKAISTPFLFYDFISLSSFAENWRDSELGQQIKHYVPHLFESSPLERTSTN